MTGEPIDAKLHVVVETLREAKDFLSLLNLDGQVALVNDGNSLASSIPFRDRQRVGTDYANGCEEDS